MSTTPLSSPAVHAALEALFGYRSFRPHQQPVVDAIMEGRDSFTVMPTGGGKSLCYQLPAHLLPGVCVVVSPLISLMKDQVDGATANGIAAATLNSATPWSEQAAIHEELAHGRLDLLYVSPERLSQPAFLEYLHTLRVSFFAVDEAHCISEWGHDFRPDYLQLSALARQFPQTPVAAFTATATTRVADDIIRRLGLRTPFCTRASFNRPNLVYQVTPKEDLDRQLRDFLAEYPDEPGIVYRTTRKDVEATAAMLRSHGVDARAYHAGLPDAERAAAQDAFRMDACRVIVATIAFGMGIDKSNVRFVVHGDMPKNLEGYYQETGRAGRDGAPARCALFFGRQDAAKLTRMIMQTTDEAARNTALRQLYSMIRFTGTETCRRRELLAYFGEALPEGNCEGCDVCLGEVEREDATVPAQKALSAMVRTGGRFGAAYIAGILVGSKREQILANGHHLLPTYGVGKDHDRSYWRTVIDALQGQGLAEAADASVPYGSPGLAVTEKGWQVLRGQAPFHMQRQAPSARELRKRRGPISGGTEALSARIPGMPPLSRGLFERLRKERLRLAAESRVPPFAVFSDRTLQELASWFPDTPAMLSAISGIGRHKLETYGQAVLTVILDYGREHPEEIPQDAVRDRLSERIKKSAAAPDPGGTRESEGEESPGHPGNGRGNKGATAQETLRLYEQGLSLQEMAQARDLHLRTILNHLETLAEQGTVFLPERFLPPERLEEFRAAFAASAENGDAQRLRPAVEALLQQKGLELAAVEPAALSELYLEATLARLLLRQEAGR